jgi:hypothetical protein
MHELPLELTAQIWIGPFRHKSRVPKGRGERSEPAPGAERAAGFAASLGTDAAEPNAAIAEDRDLPVACNTPSDGETWSCNLPAEVLLYPTKHGDLWNVETVAVRTSGSEAIVRKWLRRIRGAIGMGFTWSAAWFAVGGVPRWVFGVNTDLPLPLLFGALGFLAGVTFSGLLVLTEGRRRFHQMSLPRFAGWGAIGGILLSALFVRGASLSAGEVLAVATTFALASAACASGSLAVARRAVTRELPEGRGGAADSDLVDDANRKLRGGAD